MLALALLPLLLVPRLVRLLRQRGRAGPGLSPGPGGRRATVALTVAGLLAVGTPATAATPPSLAQRPQLDAAAERAATAAQAAQVRRDAAVERAATRTPAPAAVRPGVQQRVTERVERAQRQRAPAAARTRTAPAPRRATPPAAAAAAPAAAEAPSPAPATAAPGASQVSDPDAFLSASPTFGTAPLDVTFVMGAEFGECDSGGGVDSAGVGARLVLDPNIPPVGPPPPPSDVPPSEPPPPDPVEPCCPGPGAWQLRFGDGTQIQGVGEPPSSVTHTYSSPGTYTATLTVGDCTGSDTDSVTITVGVPPDAVLTATPTRGTAPLTVTFDGSATTATGCGGGNGGSDDVGVSQIVDDSGIEWTLDFGDGSSISGTGIPPSSISHTYSTPGVYTATLTVTDCFGSDSASVSVTVANPTSSRPVSDRGSQGEPVDTEPADGDPARRGSTPPVAALGGGEDPGAEPGDQSGDQPGEEPGGEPGEEPGAEPGEQPGDQPGTDTPVQVTAQSTPTVVTPPAEVPPPVPPPVPPLPPSLQLDRFMVEPGGTVGVRGTGCVPGSSVVLSVEGDVVGSTTADEAGAFTARISLPDLSVGRFQLVARCGTVLTAPIDLALSTRTEQGTVVTMTVLVFFVLLGLAVSRRHTPPRPNGPPAGY